MSRSIRAFPVHASACALVLIACGACQSVASPPTAGATARIQCGPTDDRELTLVVPARIAAGAASGTLTVTMGSQVWSPLERGERRLDFAPGEAARWCTDGGACTTPDRLWFEFHQVDLRDGGELRGTADVRLHDHSVSMPVLAPVQRAADRCG